MRLILFVCCAALGVVLIFLPAFASMEYIDLPWLGYLQDTRLNSGITLKGYWTPVGVMSGILGTTLALVGAFGAAVTQNRADARKG